MKVLHLLQSSHFSGAENVVCQIIGMFKDIPNVEMVYCSGDGQIREALRERDIKFVPTSDLTVKEVKRVIKEEKPDIIHAHDMRASFVAALSCKNIRLISHIHNNSFDSRGISVKSIAYILAAVKAHHIFWVSKSSFTGYAFHRLFSKKSTVLYNIIDIDSLYRKMDTDNSTYDYDVIFLGRLTYPKNPQRMMQLMGKVTNRLPNVKVAIVGTGDLEEETKTLCKDLNLEKNVTFLGFQNNPLKMVHDAKVMVMTSRWEGTPMSALEAQSLGVPIVTTPTDGLCDIITDGENGFLSSDDDILAEKICEIISNGDLLEKMRAASKDLMKKKMDKQLYLNTLESAYKN